MEASSMTQCFITFFVEAIDSASLNTLITLALHNLCAYL
jgi:hypothetical protein